MRADVAAPGHCLGAWDRVLLAMMFHCVPPVEGFLNVAWCQRARQAAVDAGMGFTFQGPARAAQDRRTPGFGAESQVGTSNY